jgi:choice-of-anchor C domain-containing protein
VLLKPPLKTTLKLALALIAPALFVTSSHAVTINIVNGSFEQQEIGAGIALYGVGSTSLTGWEITAGTIDHVGNYWQAADGNQSVDLNGESLGTIRQSIYIPANGDVRVTFAMAGNPDGDFKIKSLEVSLIGNGIPFTFDAQGFTRGNMGWREKTATFSGALAGTYYLQFKSTTTSGGPYWGAALDNVSASVDGEIVNVPEGGLTVVLLGMSLAAIGVARRFIA